MAANALTIAGTLTNSADVLNSLANRGAARWYAAYTSANHEKRVAAQLGVREVEYFLPALRIGSTVITPSSERRRLLAARMRRHPLHYAANARSGRVAV
jgi:hypothetical protein